MRKIELKKSWPKDCAWPQPISQYGEYWDEDEVDIEVACEDEVIKGLFDIKDAYDKLVEEGVLDEDYRQMDHFADVLKQQALPYVFDDYWDEENLCFDILAWRDDLSERMSMLKLSFQGMELEDDPAYVIGNIIGYNFINENLLRQAFTRRAFAVEYGLKGGKHPVTKVVNEACSEELEFLGDSVLSSIVVKECFKNYARLDEEFTEGPFRCKLNEGNLSKLKNAFCCKEYLAKRAKLLGLDKYILYGTGEVESESALEDVLEALIGAVTIDSKWNMAIVERVVDRLIALQLDCVDELLKASYYDVFNSWHQRKFGVLPNYTVYGDLTNRGQDSNGYDCVLRYFLPENNQELHDEQVVTASAETRTAARNKAAELATYFVQKHGLWIDLKSLDMVPSLENSINQLQELYQKQYLNSLPVYEFEEFAKDTWTCTCVCEGVFGRGLESSKIKAKKAAAYKVLERLFKR